MIIKRKLFANVYNKMLKNTWQMKQGFSGTLKKSINPERTYQLGSSAIRKAEMGKMTPMGGNNSWKLSQNVSNKLSKGLNSEQKLVGSLQDQMKSVGRRNDSYLNLNAHKQARGVKKVRGEKPIATDIATNKQRILNKRNSY